MTNNQAEQLTLPITVREKREVYWLAVEQKTKKRWLGLGRKVVTELVNDGSGFIGIMRNIASDDIPKIKDPILRSYLQLADTAEAMGWIPDGPGSAYCHSVHIEATDEGFDSKFVSGYVGGNDPELFMNDVHKFAPKHEDN